MIEASLPSPNVGARGYHLRRIAAAVISQLEVTAISYPNGVSPSAAEVKAFFDACSAAAATTGKAIPAMTVTPASASIAVAGTQQLTVNKGGSSGALTYVSSNPAVATVNSSGLVTGVAAGSATITVNMAEGSAHKAASKAAAITVTA